jgi:hypothetical protein
MDQVRDDGVYEVRCGAGHVTSVTLDNVKFELLFELGMHAIIDGSPRDAVSSFAASLERFHELFFRVVMAHLSVPVADVEAAWKPLSKQSERQLGAYSAAHLTLMRTPAPILANKQVEFRNQVIHNGYIPTNDEAIEFGDAVLTLIQTALDSLRAAAPDALLSTYALLSPRSKHVASDDKDLEKFTGVVNCVTTIYVRNQPKDDPNRIGGVAGQFARVQRERLPRRMYLLTEEAMKKWQESGGRDAQHIDGGPI